MGKKYPEKENLGYKITKFEDLVPLVNQILNGETLPRMVLDACQAHLGCSAEYLLENIDYILGEKIHPHWFYYENRKKTGQKNIQKPEDYFPYIQAFIGIDTMRSLSMRIITNGLADFPDSVFLLGTKAKLHFYMGEYEMAQACLARANAISPARTAETINIVRCEKKGARNLVNETYQLARNGEVMEIMKKSIDWLKR
jgi:tetratricopeptide (TPR) repeat protein